MDTKRKSFQDRFRAAVEDQHIGAAAAAKIVEFANTLKLTPAQRIIALGTATGTEVAFNLDTRLSEALGTLCNSMEDASALLYLISAARPDELDLAIEMAIKATGKSEDQIRAFGKQAQKNINKITNDSLEDEIAVASEKPKTGGVN